MYKSIEVAVIDPFKQELRYETIDNNSNPNLFTEIMQCDRFDVVRLGDNVIMYVDDEGLLIDHNRYFSFISKAGESRGYAGIAIIATSDQHGDTLSFDRDIGELREIVEWKDEGFSEEPMMEFIPLDDIVKH